MIIMVCKPNNKAQIPNISQLCLELETDYKQGMKMLYALDRARLLNLLEASGATLKNLSRPAKIYCENPNLMHALVPEADIGTIRECFFFNQLRVKHQVVYPSQGDFWVDGKYLYEIGGRKKSFSQIKDIPNSFLDVDNTEKGHGRQTFLCYAKDKKKSIILSWHHDCSDAQRLFGCQHHSRKDKSLL